MDKVPRKVRIESTRVDVNKNPVFRYTSQEQEYNEKGEVTLSIDYDDEGDLISKWSELKTPEGVVFETLKYEKGELMERIEHFETLQDNMVREIVTYIDGSQVFLKQEMDEALKIRTDTQLDEDQQFFGKEVHFFDEAGRETEIKVFDEENELTEHFRYEYLRDTGLICKEIYSNTLTEEFYTVVTRFDHRDFIVEVKHFDADDNLTNQEFRDFEGELLVRITNKDVVAETTNTVQYEYDKAGFQIGETILSEGEVVRTSKTKYNELGFVEEEETYTKGSYGMPNRYVIDRFTYEYW
ncbi:MAG: hypothetical protein KDD41_12195 [Flavobacteriales bacterium]|nr:hypothetical protein [Flavobacteriales bacterium]